MSVMAKPSARSDKWSCLVAELEKMILWVLSQLIFSWLSSSEPRLSFVGIGFLLSFLLKKDLLRKGEWGLLIVGSKAASSSDPCVLLSFCIRKGSKDTMLTVTKMVKFTPSLSLMFVPPNPWQGSVSTRFLCIRLGFLKCPTLTQFQEVSNN